MDKRLGMVIILFVTLILTSCSSESPTIESTEATIISSETTAEITEMLTEAPSALNLIKRDSVVDQYMYELVMSSDGKVVGGFNIWADGDLVRFDLADSGQSMYFDYGKKEAYIYITEGNTLMKVPIDTLGNEWESPFIFASELDDVALSAMNYKGNETLDGKKCQIFEYDNLGTTATYYVWEEEGLIIKMILEYEGQPTYEYYFKNLDINGNYDKELEIPADAKLVG